MPRPGRNRRAGRAKGKPRSELGKRLEQIADEFEDFGRRMEEKYGGEAKRDADFRSAMRERRWPHSFVTPIAWATVGLLMFGIGLLFVSFLNTFVGIALISGVVSVFWTNIALFFVSFLLSSYRRAFRDSWCCRALAPAFAAAEFTIALWLLALVFNVVNDYLLIGTIAAATAFVRASIYKIFAAAFVVAYILYLARMASRCVECCMKR